MKNEGGGGGGESGVRERVKVPDFIVTPCFIAQFIRALQLIMKLLLEKKNRGKLGLLQPKDETSTMWPDERVKGGSRGRLSRPWLRPGR